MLAFRTAGRFGAAIACCAVLAFGLSAQAGGKPEVGSAPPEVKAEGWINGEGTTLANLKGKVAVVEFWATWCPPCRRSIPHLIELHEKHAKSGLVILGLSNEPKDKVAPFVEKMKMSYLVGYGSETGQDYGVEGIPHAFVVGKDGKIIWSGNPLSQAAELDKTIEEALGKS